MKRLVIAVLILASFGCQTSDEEIRADIAGKAQKDLNFAGLNYTVQNGVVRFTGRCPSRKALAIIKQTVKNIHVIKTVTYDVTIAPLTLDTLTRIKLTADSVLANYPQVIADVTMDGVTLRGSVTAVKRGALIQDARLHIPGNVKDSVNVLQ